MSVADLRAETRAFGRARLRELALDAAREVVLDRGWSAVRMGSIATAVGISRQSLHAEFGTKDDLGEALVLREVSIFFDGMLERLEHHRGDLAGAVRDAAGYMLDAVRDNPLLQTILTRAPAQGDFSLLPLLTTRGEPLIGRAAEIFGELGDRTVAGDRWRRRAAHGRKCCAPCAQPHPHAHPAAVGGGRPVGVTGMPVPAVARSFRRALITKYPTG